MHRNFFANDVDEAEIKHCRSLLSKDNHFKIDHNDELVNLATPSQSESRPDTSNVKVTGFTIALLLVGKIQFGKLGATHVPHTIQELSLRNTDTIANTGMHKLAEALKELEDPNWKIREESMNEDEKNELRFFSPKCLNADQWDKEYIARMNDGNND